MAHIAASFWWDSVMARAHALPIDINPDRLKALVTIAGGEPVVLTLVGLG